ncbi:MAG TPA: hypothetical protein VKH19_03940 [Gemmatimonadaceae bacterium]|nr:hypothetical protein [Gemmatimonadaceae bacterium]
MTGLTSSPRVLKAGLVLLDADTGAIKRIIRLQYNPDTLSRTLEVQGTGDAGARSEALRLRGPAVETITLECEIDAVDQLEKPADNPDAVALGIHPQLAALEMMVNPTTASLNQADAMAAMGTIEIVPNEAPLAVFVWSKQRVLPVRVTQLSVTEEAFDASLNPIRAKVSLGLRVLNVDDVGFDHRAGRLFMSYLTRKEQMVSKAPLGTLADFGLQLIT